MENSCLETTLFQYHVRWYTDANTDEQLHASRQYDSWQQAKDFAQSLLATLPAEDAATVRLEEYPMSVFLLEELSKPLPF